MAIPDESVYPHATGRAAETVEHHQAPQELIFYGGWFCPFVARSWIALEEKGIPYQYKEVNPYKKEKHFLEINPKGLVPAIEYQGKALYESLVICEFLEDAFPSAPALLPADPFERAYARLWIDFVSKSIVSTFFRLIMSQQAEKQQAALKELVDACRTFAERVKGPYFLGDQFSLVDVAIAPIIVRDYFIEEHRGYSREGVSDKWKMYAATIEIRGSVLRVASDKERYEEVYGRDLRDEAQSEPAKAIRSGRDMP